MYTEMAVESDDSVSEIIRAAASSLGYAEISRDCGGSVRDRERRLSIHSYWWWQVAVLCSASRVLDMLGATTHHSLW